MKRFKNMEKKTKKVILIITSFTLFLTMGGGLFYANEINNLVQQTQEIYWQIELPTEKELKDFNEHENYKLDVIKQDRYYAFHSKNIDVLNTIQERIEDLQQEVVYRKLSDKLSKIKVHEKANKTEKDNFSKAKKEIEKMITDKKIEKDIIKKIDELAKLEDVTKTRLNKAKANNENNSTTSDEYQNDNYYDDSYYNDYSDYSDYSDYDDYSDYYEEPSYNETPNYDNGGGSNDWEDPFQDGCGIAGNCSTGGGAVDGGSGW